ncbi:MAG: PLP-dependent transferase [Geovibrio sp.]|nr:PLP-dependent transferase [Geovibrio sp.]
MPPTSPIWAIRELWVTHPASTTHRQLNAEQKAKAGITDGLIRLSVGIEHIDDIIADIEQAFAKAKKA